MSEGQNDPTVTIDEALAALDKFRDGVLQFLRTNKEHARARAEITSGWNSADKVTNEALGAVKQLRRAERDLITGFAAAKRGFLALQRSNRAAVDLGAED